ncbi:hypothetical protein C4D60_Mb00t11260 [Musa balbisiana]|uniref:Uncharacterized protein n=1 Tax=Musa balbisiana TaxID=52838 RepID=A0A4S8I7F4_MUSBA|nr:hypothetical protein C4D60_Mb00t16290 [Musa balbisiana]THU42755.1 hypothetical protein C4D60_Mb00t15680 [Musa balbisiana]THU42756.1 hypothetical protein C4D60_Mb00t15690 [Musa balbisiana]THU42952.1 hypothetical protein C4D60_Mb00t04260 [Musa balbisiana]THU43039.1 hypothetical protein C4D60_Mb00t03560 [Musa balbisiana]
MIRTVSKTQHAFCCIGLFHQLEQYQSVSKKGYLDLVKWNLYRSAATVEYETSYTLKFIGRKEVILRPLYSLCLALNGLGIYLINYQINGGFYLIWQLNSRLNRTEPNICQAIVLLFPRTYGVRH